MKILGLDIYIELCYIRDYEVILWNTEKVFVESQSGVEKLEQERDNLINVERPKVIEVFTISTFSR